MPIYCLGTDLLSTKYAHPSESGNTTKLLDKPEYHQIATNTNPLTASEMLTNINWYRTIVCSLVFLIGLINNIKTIIN